MESLYPQNKQKSRSNDRVQKFLDFKEIRDGNIILKTGQMRAVVMVSSINFFLMNEEEQNAVIYGYQGFLNSLDFPIQIVIQSKKLNVKQYLARVEEQARLQENELLRQQTELYGAYIKDLVELANITTNHFYVIVPSGGGVDLPKKLNIFKKLTSFMDPAEVVGEQLVSLKQQAEALDVRTNHVLGGLRSMGLKSARLNTQEVVELLYTTYNPGTSEYQMLADLEKLDISRL